MNLRTSARGHRVKPLPSPLLDGCDLRLEIMSKSGYGAMNAKLRNGEPKNEHGTSNFVRFQKIRRF